MAAGISIGLASQHPPQLDPPQDPTQYGKTLPSDISKTTGSKRGGKGTTTTTTTTSSSSSSKDLLVEEHGPFDSSYGTAVLLTDIQGSEDHLGDMDFKVAGTAVGITAVQLDTKLPGVDLEVLVAALKPAARARVQLLREMEGAVECWERETAAEMRARHGVLTINKELVPRLVGLQVTGVTRGWVRGFIYTRLPD
jgi:polyribonucleotide nucleotidyltransferase